LAIDAINKVSEQESRAEEMIANATAKAKQLVADAGRNGKNALEDAVARAESRVNELMKDAELSAANAAMEITAQAEAECEKLRTLAAGRMEKAAEFIVEKVVNG